MEQMKVEQGKGIKSDRGVTFNRAIRAGHIEKQTVEVGEGFTVAARAPRSRHMLGEFQKQ